MQDFTEEFARTEMINMYRCMIDSANEHLDETKLSARIKLQLIRSSRRVDEKSDQLIDSFILSEVKDKDDPNTLQFDSTDLGTITYSAYEKGKTIFDHDKLGTYLTISGSSVSDSAQDEKFKLYFTAPEQVIAVWNRIIDVIKDFESKKISPSSSRHESVSVRDLDYFEKLLLIKAERKADAEHKALFVIAKLFPPFGSIYHSHDETSQQLRDKGIEFYLSSI